MSTPPPVDDATALPTIAAPRRLAVLTSGGDSPGMNAAVRAVVRTGLRAGLEMFGVSEGLQGLVEGGKRIKAMESRDVSGILQRGGTVLGTARSADFRTREGRKQAARNVIEHGIEGLVVIGGDGSLTGADTFRAEWPEHVAELLADGAIDEAAAEAHRRLALVGLVGSIDNDMFGTDMTIGADTALHRIVAAIDAIQSTASSHQRTFVIEVMGRNCGYLALMAGLATAANFVLIPESPPGDDWETAMCEHLAAGRTGGRRASIVIVAEGALDVNGTPVTADAVKTVLETRLGEDARVTILGHLQRGGSPSAFDRYLGSMLGHAAVRQLIDEPGEEAQVIGVRGHKVTSSPLVEAVARTRSVADLIAARDFDGATELRGRGFGRSLALLRTLIRARPRYPESHDRDLRIAVMHAGSPAPGMNAAARVAVRVAMDQGHTVVGIRDGFDGLLRGDVRELDWMSVSGWVSRPGVELGTSRRVPAETELELIAGAARHHQIDAILMIGGWSGYTSAHRLDRHLTVPDGEATDLRSIPIVCLPATIANDLPGTDLSIGPDTALNGIATDVDKIKESAVGPHRCFIVEVMGADCGYLPLMSALASGAERVYLPEEGISLARLVDDLEVLKDGFLRGKRRGLVIRGENSDNDYTVGFIETLFTHESGGLFDVRTAVLGPIQQGGSPSPFDRIEASRLAAAAIDHLVEEAQSPNPLSSMIGTSAGRVTFTPLSEFPSLIDSDAPRAAGTRWWASVRPLIDVIS